MTLDNAVIKSLDEILSIPGNPLSACNNLLNDFNAVSASHNVPAALLASIALQESTCRSGVIGPNGEVGLMQLTPDKCVNDGRCWNDRVCDSGDSLDNADPLCRAISRWVPKCSRASWTLLAVTCSWPSATTYVIFVKLNAQT